MNESADKLQPHMQRLVDAGVSGIDIMHGEMKLRMLEAEAQLAEAQRIEDETEEAMDSMERKYWEGMLDAYTEIYKDTYDISFALAAKEAGE
jgi:hypothetical protein